MIIIATMDLDHQLKEAINSIAKKIKYIMKLIFSLFCTINLCIITSFISGIRFAVRELNQIKLIKEIIGFQDWIERITIRQLAGISTLWHLGKNAKTDIKNTFRSKLIFTIIESLKSASSPPIC